MARSAFDKGEIALACPQCGRETKKTIAWVKANNHLTCPGCGERIKIDKTKLLRGLEKADKALADLSRQFKRLK